jgi:membrane dipeptidase
MRTLFSFVAWLVLSHHGRTSFAVEVDPLYTHAIKLMSESPLIDTHVDLPQIIRGLGKLNSSYPPFISEF